MAGAVDFTGVSESEARGLYRAAAHRTLAVETATEALAMLGRNEILLSAGERLKLRDLRERLASLD